MAGFYNTLKFDSCANDFETFRQAASADYQLNLNANYRTHEPPIMPLSVVGQPSFWGPLAGSNVTKESFLQGRGQTLADCPDCEVTWLPETLFPVNTQHNQMPLCERTDLEPLQTRMKRSCNGLEETDTSQYWMMPSEYQPQFMGMGNAVSGNLQTRLAPSDTTMAQGAQSMGSCRANYGIYGSSRSFAPYSF